MVGSLQEVALLFRVFGWAALLPPVLAAGALQAHKSAPAQLDITEALISQFDSADVIALGELHWTREDSTLRINLIHNPDFPRRVRFILVEFASASHQRLLDQYIRGADVPEEDIEKVWRDITTPGGADSPVYAQFLNEVRSINKNLPEAFKVRVLAGDPPINWSEIKGPDDWRRIASARDSFAAELIGREVLQTGQKALLVYGAGHIWRNARGGPIPADSTLVPLLDHTYPGRIYSVLPIAGGVYPDTEKLERSIEGKRIPVLLPLKTTPVGALDPNEFIAAPFHLPFRLFPPGVTLAEVADACVYRGQSPDTTVNPGPDVEFDKIYAAEKARRRGLVAPAKR
jgi:hypothetical protein